MRLRVLGAMEVDGDGGWQPVRALKQRMLLATLLLGGGSPVSIDRLVDQLWPDERPGDPTNQVYLLVSRLRRVFGADGAQLIRTIDPGYVCALAPGDVDAGRFEQLAERGSRALAGGELDLAVQQLTEALELWRGPAYADTSASGAAAAEATRLEQVRLAALESRLDAELRLGRHAAVTGELQRLAEEHPFRERFRGLLMLALYRSGRQAEALEAYGQAHRRLVEELGVEPGPELRDLQQRMLRADPALSGPALELAMVMARPAQLPTDLPSMTGRQAELDQLLALADRVGEHPGAAVIAAIDGMAGIGKTALAVHAAHRVADALPDGQVFLDLHGFTRGLEPLAPATALERLLRSIGVPGEAVPDGVDDRAALWRSRLAGKRLVLLLDNAVSESQVRPLLPGSGCLVLATSRHRLGDLDDAVPVALDVLSSDAAIDLFRLAAGPGRLDGEPEESVAEAVELCGRLPLAIRLLAGRLRKRPAWRLADLLDRLRQDHARVGELDTGKRSVAAAFALSYEPLDPDQRRLFRRLGLHPGADFDAYAAAALADLDLRTAECALEELVDVNLLQSHSFARYTFHDLVRAYAAETAQSEDPEPDCAAAIDRLLSYYTRTAADAMDACVPDRRRQRPEVGAAEVQTPDFGAGNRRALAWLDRERANLVAAGGCAADAGRPARAYQLSNVVSRYLRNGPFNSDAMALHEHHLRAARAEGNRTEEALALWLLGSISFHTSGKATTVDYLRQALALLPEDDRTRRASLLADLSAALRAHSAFSESRDCLRTAAELYREHGDRKGEAHALCGMSEVAQVLGEFEAAEEHGLRAVALAEEFGDSWTRAYSHHSLGFTYVAMARHESALEHLRVALRLGVESGRRHDECIIHALIGTALCGLGRDGEALESAERGLALAREIQFGNGELEASHSLGEVLLACGRAEEAVEHLTVALDLAVRLEQPLDEAREHKVLGAAVAELGRSGEAHEHRQWAQELYTQLGVPARPEPA
ncbi:BTAD domain-containing putative transcriptional regulator [Flindersiella endophytica]